MLQARTIGGMSQQNNTANIERVDIQEVQEILNLGLTGLMFHFDMYEILETMGCTKYARVHSERLKHEVVEYSEMVSLMLKDAGEVYRVQNIERYKQQELDSLRGYRGNDAIEASFKLWYEWESNLSDKLTEAVTNARNGEMYYRESIFKKWLFNVRREILEIVDMKREIED